MKAYFYLCAAVLVIVGGFGLGAPYLLSQPDDIAVVLGIVLLIFLPLTLGFLIKQVIGALNKDMTR